MTDIHQSYNPQNHPFAGTSSHHQHNHHVSPRVHQAVKAATAATAGGSLLVLSGLVLVLTVISLTIATPLLVIFSPVLVPAAITVFLLITGFLTSGGFGVAAVTVLSWIYKYATGGHPPGADSLDQARNRLGYKGTTGMGQHETGGAAQHRALA